MPKNHTFKKSLRRAAGWLLQSNPAGVSVKFTLMCLLAMLAVIPAVSRAVPASAAGGESPANASEFNPAEIWPDKNGVPINAHGGGILFHEGIYYWFGEHKIEGGAGNVAQVGVHVYSSTDLYHWCDEGIALKVSDDPKSDIAKGCILERPKVIYNKTTKKFVMWFHLEPLGQGYHAARAGVAVADKVTGPYAFLGSSRVNAGVWPLNIPADWKKPLTPAEMSIFTNLHFPGGPEPGCPDGLILRGQFADGQMLRDMNLFVDDDGRAYVVYASEDNATLHLSLLDKTYTKTADKYIRIAPMGCNESPALFKHDGRYFLITSRCNGWDPSDARLFTAKTIWGPWQALGNPCVGTEEQKRTTFESQATFVLPVAGKRDAFIFMADRWRPENAIDGRYVWLPIQWNNGIPFLQWKEHWNLEMFDALAKPETAVRISNETK